VFDDLVELGLGDGRITPRLASGLARVLAADALGRTRPATDGSPAAAKE
jgi:hypothetical protein